MTQQLISITTDSVKLRRTNSELPYQPNQHKFQMTSKFHVSITMLTFVTIFCVDVAAQQPSQFSDEIATTITESELQTSEDWDLTIEEVKSLENLKRSNKGMISADITPLEWLGIFAETDEQRQYYASIFARRQLEIMDAITKFELAYAEAMKKEISQKKEKSEAGVRLLLVASYECSDSPCQSNLTRALKHVEEGGRLDILLLENLSLAGLRHWIAANEIPTDKIQTRAITVNSAQGRYQNLSLGLFNLD